jgi:hypothetical protein
MNDEVVVICMFIALLPIIAMLTFFPFNPITILLVACYLFICTIA